MALRKPTSGLILPMRIWDLPTRLFHWVLVLLIIGSYVTIKANMLTLHVLCGETILVLVLWRLVWGLVGSDTARFSQFIRSPFAAIRHLLHFARREPDTQIGHNEAGGWVVLGLLALLLAQIGTGLFGRNDDDFVEGPLAKLIAGPLSEKLMSLHSVIFDAIMIVVLLHVIAIIAYAVVKRHDLVRPMFTGKKRLPAATPAPRMASPVLATAIMVVAAVAVWLMVTRV
jgi:cytochrome b